jgi:hypothetical protein
LPLPAGYFVPWLANMADSALVRPLPPHDTQRPGRSEVSAEHYRALFERELVDKNQCKAWLYDAWKALRQQQKGMNRMARKIKRLQRELAAARSAGGAK